MKKFEYREHTFFDGLGTLYAHNLDDPRYPHSVGYRLILVKFKAGELAAEYWRLRNDWASVSMLGRHEDGNWVSSKSLYKQRLDSMERFATLPDVDWEKEMEEE